MRKKSIRHRKDLGRNSSQKVKKMLETHVRAVINARRVQRSVSCGCISRHWMHVKTRGTVRGRA